MPEPRHVLQAGHPDYGRVCPECASPKHRQSKRCAQCYYDARRRHEFPAPPVPQRRPPVVRVTGGSKGRPQPQSHPWRGKNKLLFRKAA